MDKKFEDLAEKIFKDENLVKEILNIYDFDSLYDKIKSIEPEISKSELEDFMNSFDKNNLPELTEDNLNSVSGGTSNKSRAMAAVMAMLMGVTPLLNANAANKVKNKETRDNKTTTQKVKDWASKHKVLTSIGAGTVFLTSLFCGKKIYDHHQQERREQEHQEQEHHQQKINTLLDLPDQELANDLNRKFKEQLLPLLPNLWSTFWSNRDAVENAANVYTWGDYDAAEEAAKKAAWDAARDAFGAAKDAAKGTAWNAAENAAENAAKDIFWKPTWNDVFAKSWRQGGKAYNIVRNEDDDYFRNLVKVLVQQTKILKDIINQHTQGSN